VLGHVAQSALNASVQALIILGVGFLMGARIDAGPVGWLVVIVIAMLVAACFSGISHGIALLARREETMIALANFIALPLMFLSSTLIAFALMPGWMQWGARFNPVQWGVDAAREMVDPSQDWAIVGLRALYLTAFAVLTSAFATWSFRAYRRTL
jgi:ABC-2 type transport system permease protein